MSAEHSKTVLITGTNRGIGLSLAKHYSEFGYNVIACCRHSSPELRALDVQVIEGIDIAMENVGQRLSDALHDTHIDLLINNAGILRDEQLGVLEYESIQLQFNVNTLGPLRVTEAVLEHLNENAKIVFITSRMGSIADNSSGGRYGYRMSKCALNAAAVSMSHDLKNRGIAVGIFHPGLVGTDMIGGHGNVTPDQAAKQLSSRIDELDLTSSATFQHADGELLPW